jgi:GT2 family glycosyltransferase
VSEAHFHKLYSIIVLCYNHIETTKRCLDCLFQTDLSKAEVIVVDNHSEDGTYEYLETLIDRLRVIYRCERNLGVGEGYNEGFKFVRTPFFLTINNDMLVHEKDWLWKMTAHLVENPQIAQVGIEGTSCWLDKRGGGHPLPHPDLKPDYVETSCMMARTDAVRAVGPLFDPAYKFAYCEDSDLSLRLREKGWEITHIPLSVEHIGSVTLGDKSNTKAMEYFIQNHARLQRRWAKYLETRHF